MRFLPTFVLAAGLIVPATFAQTAAPAVAASPACNGAFAIIRVSDIKPDSSIDKFLAAVAAQKSWYAAHVPADKIFVSRIRDRGASDYSTTEAITYHFYGGGPEPKHDADFGAFVQLFSDSSIIKATYFTCIPAGMVPAN